MGKQPTHHRGSYIDHAYLKKKEFPLIQWHNSADMIFLVHESKIKTVDLRKVPENEKKKRNIIVYIYIIHKTTFVHFN